MQPTYYRAHPTQTKYGLLLGFSVQSNHQKAYQAKHVSFAKQNEVNLFDATSTPSIMLAYDSGSDGYYIRKYDQPKAGLPILRPSTWQVGVANGGTSNAKYATQLPF